MCASDEFTSGAIAQRSPAIDSIQCRDDPQDSAVTRPKRPTLHPASLLAGAVRGDGVCDRDNDTMAHTLGWLFVAFPVVLTAYTYVVYPVALWAIAQRHRKTGAGPMGDSPTAMPLVSIVVPAYNEEAQIRGAIEALVSQDYPADRRQILILSDASTDRTDEIVGEYASRGVELLRMPVRGGKTAAENASVTVLRGEIIINSDASVRLHPAAVRRMIESMADPLVGVASTRDVSVAPGAERANAAEGGYVGYEMMIRSLETRTGGIVGASGSGYAIRAQLHRIPVRADLSRDFSAALTARTHGFSAVSVDDALCFVPRTSSLRSEYRRKVRTVARGADTLIHQRHLLDAIRYGSFSWKLVSHKICRWLVPASGIPGVLGLVLLARSERWALVALALCAAAGIVAAIGAFWPARRPMPRAVSLLTFAISANVAVVHALMRVAYGHEDHLWEPTRRAPTPAQT
jgi:cellulose synthase/poly-beta-1,6-N-acetylglucosamine synthase-like glycosyltransferase